MNINRALKFIAVPVLISVYVGCSPVNFAKDEELSKCQGSGKNCISKNGKDYFDESINAAGGLVDILIVDDNSASMSFEQTRLAARFNGFIQNLENQKADYRIAITTTDISSAGNPPSSINKNNALQDGHLIEFPNGSYFLTSASGTLVQKNEWFKTTIQRKETLDCESFIRNNFGKSTYNSAYAANCPSGDERGINAANLVVKNNPNSFIRPNSHLAIIILSDEDERSQLYWYNEKSPESYPGYDLENFDLPQTLLNNVRATYGGGKAVSIHSIITMTQSCKNIQDNQLVVNGTAVVNGSYGLIYNKASQMTQGVVGDICASDYTSQLGQISTNILSRVNSALLACENPSDLLVSIIGQPGVTYSISGREVRFSAQLSPGTRVGLKYTCNTL
jgi:hypothetical protein